MAWLELTLPCDRAQEARYQTALEDIGALAVTLTDANADAPDEQAIFEPGVGETPLWRTMTLTALFPADAVADVLLHALDAFDPELDLAAATFRRIEDQDWERVWMDQFQPMQFGRRTFIVPWNQEMPAVASGADAAVVRLDPGLAFGTGTHPTTALCLAWLDGLDLGEARVLDFGCGSGILAIAAALFGAGRVEAVDIDPAAVESTRVNAAANGVAVHAGTPDAAQDRFDLVLANILATPLKLLAPVLCAHVEPGGDLVLAGILERQADELEAAYAPHCALEVCDRDDGWILMTGRMA